VSEFDRDTAVRGGDGIWAGRIDPRWNIGDNPNGGYTLVVAANAMLAACGRPDPLTLTAHYLAPPAMGEVEVAVEILRAGRRYATVSATMRQGDRGLVGLVGAFGDLASQEGPTRIGAAPPEIPAPEDCVSMLELGEYGGGRPVPEFIHRFDLRLDPGCEWVHSRIGGAQVPTEPADSLTPLEVAGWIRFGDDAPPSVVGLLAMADAFPTTVVASADIGWVPTVELTVHVRGRPVPGWILGVFRTRFLIHGLLEQDGELWDAGGHLVALSRQMALVLPTR
jgi:acyl-CoA thioesterase